ncbi:MAG: AsmA family protein [Gammaproteobacteria bacterium]|nr:AsmA family protein [Gammaproteobacteria bacterium]
MPIKPPRPTPPPVSSKLDTGSGARHRSLKITIIVVAVIGALLLTTAIVLPFIINPNDFKPRIVQLVKHKTGRELSIPGDIRLSIFPWLGVQIGPMQLANATGFGSMPFASSNETDVHVRFWPLLRGKLEVGAVKLDGLHLDLERDAGGRDNWGGILEHLRAGRPANQAGTAPAGGLANLRVQGLVISDSGLRWNDAQQHQQYTVSNFSVDLGEFMPGKPVRLSTSFDFTGTNPQLNGHVDFKSTVIADLVHRIYTTDNARLDVSANGDAVPGGRLSAELLWQHTAVNLEAGTLALNGLSAGVYGLKAQMNAEGKDILKTPVITGSLKLEPFAPRALLQALGHGSLADTRDANALTRAAANFDFSIAPESVALPMLDIKLDDTTITGKLALKDFKSRALSFDLNLDQLDADRYLPSQKASPNGKPREQTDINKISLPVRTLRRLDLDGRLRIGQFTLLNARSSDVDVSVTAHKGLLRVDPLSAQLYGGSLGGDLQIDASNDTPIVAGDLDLKNVQAAGLVQDLFKMNRLSGSVDMHAALRALGQTMGEIRHTLSGRMNFAFSNGAIEGINIWDAIARGYALLKHMPPPPPAPERTPFAEMHGSAAVSGGVVSNRDFSAVLPFLKLSGEGKLDLAELTVDYSLQARVTGTPKLGAQQDLSRLAGASIPLRITGTLSKLNVRPDLGGMLQETLHKAIDKKKAGLRDKARNKLKDLLHDAAGGGG